MVPWAHPSLHPKQHLDHSAVFAQLTVECTISLQWVAAFSPVGKKNPQSCPFPWDFVTLLEEDWTTAMGNTHKKIGTGLTCGVGDMLAHTHRRAHYNTLPPLPQAKQWEASGQKMKRHLSECFIPVVCVWQDEVIMCGMRELTGCDCRACWLRSCRNSWPSLTWKPS